jgi:hypothetical protein
MKTFVLVTSIFLFAGCSHMQRIDQKEFEKYTNIHQEKLVSIGLIGYTNQNVYIEKLTKRLMSAGWNVDVLWIPIDELSKEQIEKVKALGESRRDKK